MQVLSCIATEHNLWLVVLAACVCVSGSWVSFDLIQRARDRRGVQKSGWIFLSAVACGSSIWCTHFIAMLAYEAKAPVSYDPLLTLASLIVAIVGCGLGIYVSLSNKSTASPVLGGATIGWAIAIMHYTGMHAYHVDGLVEWDPAYVIASFVFVVVLGATALQTFMRATTRVGYYSAIALFVAAIVLLHFTGMTAVSVTPFVTGAVTMNASEFHAMAVAIAGVALIILATGIASHLIDSRASSETVQRLEQLALFDTLTALPNRVGFLNTLTQQLVRSKSETCKCAVVCIDLDRFKEINDLRGHEAGDQTLRLVARRLTALLGQDESVARVGGDEFGATKLFRKPLELADFLGRIEAALTRPLQIGDIESVTGASIGVSVYPQDGDTPERLIGNSDLAMHRAKAEINRSVCFYEPAMDEQQRHRRMLAQDLRLAVDRGELELNYQVQTVVATNEICGYEVLLRWNHAQLGRIPPSDFIPLAEETGTIIAIGDWVLRTACTEAATWTNAHKIAVNISPVQLSYVDLAQRVTEILTETGLPPHRLELEITETAIIANKERSLHQLRRIRALGVSIAIDDFGTGYSSLDTLRSFPFDKIKLDRSFISELESSAQATAIIRAVLALGKSLNIAVLAEGVETKDQLSILEREGCDEAQGYYFGRPMGVASVRSDPSRGQTVTAAA